MKNYSIKTLRLLLFTTLITMSINSCKKDDEPIVEKKPTTYAEIQLTHIKALDAKMVTSNLVATDANGLVFKTGDVFVYKTNAGHYGKFQIVNIDPGANYKLTLKITNYADDGSVLLATNSVDIRGTWFCDLDIVAETGETADDDFHWNRLTKTDTRFDPKHGAKFVKFNFKS